MVNSYPAKGLQRLERANGSLFFLGIGLIAGSPWMILSYLPLGLYLSLFVIPREEAYMERVFGNAYRACCRRGRRKRYP